MNCGYCNWSTLDIGWQFEKLSNIQAQIAKLDVGADSKAPVTPGSPESLKAEKMAPHQGSDAMFKQMKSFYSSQLSTSTGADPLLSPSGGLNYSSPASLQRILSLYTSKGSQAKRGGPKTGTIRESADESEGLRVIGPDEDAQIIDKLRSEGWSSTASLEQRSRQERRSRFISDLRPVPNLLRTKRNKRCRTCRHILVKPEPKVQTTRFRIRLLAINYVPTITATPLQPAPLSNLPSIDLKSLPVLKPIQFLLTLKNPLYDSVRVTLATPAQTPGRHGHKVTILCPDFEIGPNIDKWDEALAEDRGKRTSRILPGSFSAKPEYVGGEGGKVAEAGKVWEKGRNWTSVVVEFVCSAIGGLGAGEEEEDEGDDENILETPIFVRAEWEGDMAADEGIGAVKGEGKEKRELAYWAVVGIGRVGSLDSSSQA